MKKTIILLVLIVGLMLVPFFIPHAGNYSGSDNQAEQAISKIDPNYKPWFAPIFAPASGEIESLLFTLQGSIGSAIVFYILGYYRGKRAANANH